MRNDLFRALADTYSVATTLRVPPRRAEKRPAPPEAETPPSGAHPLLASLLDLEVIRRFRSGARAPGCG